MINLGMNENPLGCSKKAIEAMQQGASSAHLYPEFYCESLKNALEKHYHMSADHIMITNGSSAMIELLGAQYIQPSDEVVFCVPTFMIYKSMCENNGGKAIMFPLTKDLRYDLLGLLNAINDKTKMLVIVNPNNPTGTFVSEEELLLFLDQVPSHIKIVVDEAYIEFAKSKTCKSLILYVDRYPNMIVLRTFSKMYGLAGMRIGYAFASKSMIEELESKLYVFTVNKLGALAALASLNDQEFFDYSYQSNDEGREYLTKELTLLGGHVYPSETNFLYVLLPIEPALLATRLKEEGFIIQGNNACNRISIGTMEQNKQLIEKIKQILKEE